MRGVGRVWTGGWRGRGLALTLLALLMQALMPAGVMIGDGPAGPGLVICTGHGPLLAAQDPAHPSKAPAPHRDALCAFAGHGIGAPPVAAAGPAEQTASMTPLVTPILPELTPGRGLAAPPPPSQGPPRST